MKTGQATQQVAQPGVTHTAPEPTTVGCQLATALPRNLIDSDSAAVGADIPEPAEQPPHPAVDPEPITIDDLIASVLPKLDAVRANLGVSCRQAMPPGCKVSGYRLANASLQQMKSDQGIMHIMHMVGIPVLGKTRFLTIHLVQAEADQRWNLNHDTPRYCQFLKLRQLWFKLLHTEAKRWHHFTDGELVTAATHLVKQWIQDMQQAYGTLLPAEDGVSSNHEANVQPQMLPGSTSSGDVPAATGHAD